MCLEKVLFLRVPSPSAPSLTSLPVICREDVLGKIVCFKRTTGWAQPDHHILAIHDCSGGSRLFGLGGPEWGIDL